MPGKNSTEEREKKLPSKVLTHTRKTSNERKKKDIHPCVSYHRVYEITRFID